MLHVHARTDALLLFPYRRRRASIPEGQGAQTTLLNPYTYSTRKHTLLACHFTSLYFPSLSLPLSLSLSLLPGGFFPHARGPQRVSQTSLSAVQALLPGLRFLPDCRKALGSVGQLHAPQQRTGDDDEDVSGEGDGRVGYPLRPLHHAPVDNSHHLFSFTCISCACAWTWTWAGAEGKRRGEERREEEDDDDALSGGRDTKNRDVWEGQHHRFSIDKK